LIFINTVRKSQPERDPVIDHIDEWQQLSERKRADALGINFFEDTKTFFTMSDSQIGPRYRPTVRVPELQTMLMRDANDLSEYQPQAYIYDSSSGKEIESIQKGFQAQWNQMFVPFHLLFAFLTAEFFGTGFLNWGIDPYESKNRGRMWAKSRDPKTVHLDPNTDYTFKPSFLILEDWVHLDLVKQRFPERAKFLPKFPTNTTKDIRNTESQQGFRLPDGPYQSMPPFNNISSTRGLATRLRTTFCLDYTREIEGGNLPADPDALAKYRWVYPRGRVVIDCEGVRMADGQCPFQSFPVAPVWGTPPLFGPWAVPPTRYTESLQVLAEKMYSQTFENFYRLNNGVWFIPKASGISQSDFGGVAGEKQMYDGDKPPNLVTPPAFPDSASKLPETLLEKARQIQGFNQSRQGKPGDGNISSDLFDASVLQGQGLTQLRGRMGAFSVLRSVEGITSTMIEYMPSQMMGLKQNGSFEVVDYRKPADALDQYTMLVDDGSFHVKSQSIVRRIAEQLMAKGALPVGAGLEMLGYPDAAKIGKKIDENRALAALGAVNEPHGGKR
jgi:hypothetical protein